MPRSRLPRLLGSVAIALAALMGQAQAQSFEFVALGDLPYGPPAQSYPPYRALIDRVNQVAPAFSIHVGDIKSGSTLCTDEEFANQVEHFSRYQGAVIYTPGDNEWTDCHRANNGRYDPQERLAALRKRFFTEGRSLGQKPLAVENQSRAMPAFGKYIENQRWQHQGVVFATLHMVGSNNNLEVRDRNAALEFFDRDAANVAWLEAAFAQAQQSQAHGLVIAFQADVFDIRSASQEIPEASGFYRTIVGTLLPLAKRWGKPVLVIHGDSHQFRLDQPFTLDKKPLPNVTRLIVPGAADVRAVRVRVGQGASFGFELFGAGEPAVR